MAYIIIHDFKSFHLLAHRLADDQVNLNLQMAVFDKSLLRHKGATCGAFLALDNAVRD